MRIELIPSAVGSTALGGSTGLAQFLTSIRIGDSICLDAGSIGYHADLDLQRSVRHVFLSHSHIDHTASLPMLLDNVFGVHPEGVHIYLTKEVETALREDLFNDRTWPDFIRISEEGPQPLLTLHRIEPDLPVVVEGITITPISVDHVVPTVGFVVDDGNSAIVVATDTGPSQTLWDVANAIPHLKAVLLEASFPEELSWLADVAKHLTPRLFAEEIGKLAGDPTLFALHLKATHRDEIIAELERAGVDRLVIMEPGTPYEV
jgi:ribonuclease BN (tRNA processing enzyme)